MIFLRLDHEWPRGRITRHSYDRSRPTWGPTAVRVADQPPGALPREVNATAFCGKQSIDPAAAAFTASPWAYNGKIFALSEDGDTFVMQAGPEFKLLAKNTLDEMCMATPAIYRSSLIVRTASKLYRIGKGGENYTVRPLAILLLVSRCS